MSSEGALQQRSSALSRANVVRCERGRLKRDIAAGRVSVVEVLMAREWWIESCPVHELLDWAPKVGGAKVDRVLRRARVWPLKPVGRLTEAQVQRLLEELRGR